MKLIGAQKSRHVSVEKGDRNSVFGAGLLITGKVEVTFSKQQFYLILLKLPTAFLAKKHETVNKPEASGGGAFIGML